MIPIIEDILDVVFGVQHQYRRRNLPDYSDPRIRPRLEPGETGQYLWDGSGWAYDPEATVEEAARYSPS